MRLCASSKATVAVAVVVVVVVVVVVADVAVAVAVAAVVAAAVAAAAAVVECRRGPRRTTNTAGRDLGDLPLGGGRPGRTDCRAARPTTPDLCPR